MQECNYAESYLGGEINSGITSLKMEILGTLEKENLTPVKIQQMENQVGKGNAYAFLAEREIRKNSLDSAHDFVKKGLAEDPSSLWLIRLNVFLIKRKSANDTESIRKALEDYVRVAYKRFDILLSFELAMETFKSGDTKAAMKLFREINERTKNHPMRLTPDPRNRWLEDGRPKELLGVITQPPRYGAYGKIECTSLPGFRGPLPVRVQDVEFRAHGGERVAYEIIFNMVGPQASRVRRVAF